MPFGQPSSATTTPSARLVPDTTSMPSARLVPMSGEEDSQFLGQIDQRTGAPMNLRAAVAAVRRPAQKLEIIRKVDPNAQPYGNGNFVYTPPGASEPILFDPKGIKDIGKDLVEGLPMISEIAGSIGGGIFGGMVGNVPGALGGAGIGGGAARDFTEQAMMAATGQQDPRTLGQRAVDVGITTGASALGEGAGRLVAPVGRAIASRTAGTPTGIAVRAAAERIQVPLTAGMASGRRFLQNVEASLASNPVTFGIMNKAATDAAEAATRASGRIVQQIARGSDTSPDTFAAALQGAAAGRIQRFQNVRQTMDDAIGSLIPQGTMVPVDNVENTLGALLAYQAKAPSSFAPEVANAVQMATRLLNDAAPNGGMVPFEVLRNIRKTVGEAAFQGLTPGGKVAGGTEHLRDLYFALGDDIKAAGNLIDGQAMAAGLPSPGARQAIELHDEFVRVNRDPNNPVSIEALQQMLKINPASPSQWAATMSRDPRKAEAFRRAVTPEEWDTIAGTVVEDLGRAAPGVQGVAGETWSPTTFLTNWNRIGARGREAMFGGTRYASSAQSIDDLARVAEAMRESGKLSNTSNTARALLVPLMAKAVVGTGAIGAAGAMGGSRAMGATGAGLILSSWAAAKLLTSPRVMQTIRNGVTAGARSGPSTLARLVTIGRADPALQSAINEYIAAIGQAGYPLPDPATVQQLNTGSPAVQFTPR